MDIPLTRRWLEAVAAALAEQADYLTQLDSAIGDADHGVNMHRGFTAVLAALDGYAPASVGDLLVRTGTTLVSKVGGASGPLYGTAFRAVGKALPQVEASPAELVEALQAGLDGVRKLGTAQPGDKTIVDAWEPAVAAMRAAAAASPDDLAAVAAAGAAAAGEGMRATTAMQAHKGRASYLGPRSVGHQDPGATSTWLIFKALAEVSGGSAGGNAADLPADGADSAAGGDAGGGGE